MIHHLCLLKAKPEVTAQKLEEIIVETRIRLLKIPEINNLRVGKRIDAEKNPYTYFFNFDTENLDKLKYSLESAIYVQFQKQILDINVASFISYDYEMEPGKDVKYS